MMSNLLHREREWKEEGERERDKNWWKLNFTVEFVLLLSESECEGERSE